MGDGWGRREDGGAATFISLTGWSDGGEGEKRRKSGMERKSGERRRYRIEQPLESDVEIALTGRHRRSEESGLWEGSQRHMEVHPGHWETLKGGISQVWRVGGADRRGVGVGQGFHEQTNTPRGSYEA